MSPCRSGARSDDGRLIFSGIDRANGVSRCCRLCLLHLWVPFPSTPHSLPSSFFSSPSPPFSFFLPSFPFPFFSFLFLSSLISLLSFSPNYLFLSVAILTLLANISMIVFYRKLDQRVPSDSNDNIVTVN